MKNFTIPLIIVTLLLQSCSSRFTLVKRQYRKGYYLDLPQKAIALPLEAEPPGLPYRSESTDEEILPPVIEGKVQPIETDPLLVAPVAPVKLRSNADPQGIRKYGKQRERSIKQDNTLAQPPDAGYIVWTIIGILVLIWLIALITGGWGLGGLIYILLAVALVLLLLRLIGVLMF